MINKKNSRRDKLFHPSLKRGACRKRISPGLCDFDRSLVGITGTIRIVVCCIHQSAVLSVIINNHVETALFVVISIDPCSNEPLSAACSRLTGRFTLYFFLRGICGFFFGFLFRFLHQTVHN